MKSTPDSPTLTPAQQALADWLGELHSAFTQYACEHLSRIEFITPEGKPETPDPDRLIILQAFDLACQRAGSGDDAASIARGLAKSLAEMLNAWFNTELMRQRVQSGAADLTCARVDARRDLAHLHRRLQTHLIALGQLNGDLGETLQDLAQAQARQANPDDDV